MCLKIVFILCTFVIQALSEQCTTPNNEIAQCMSLYSCPVLLGALVTQQNASIEFVRKSSCGGTPSDPLVCCGSSSTFTNDVRNQNAQITTPRSLLSDRRYCGFQHTDDYFHAQNSTAVIDEFPWLALLLYKSNKKEIKTEYRCSGSLINSRYVLTAAHCLNIPNYNLTSVRLGDFNVKNKTDCTQDGEFYDCSEAMEFGIETKIIHSGYNTKTVLNRTNDIALLRVNESVTYTDFIRPICLPFPGSTLAKVGDILTTTGWGRSNKPGKLAETKKKILTALISKEECAEHYDARWSFITENHICTNEINTNIEFGCAGDSGGPVMFSHRNQWHQEGILSFSLTGCRGKYPEVHTKLKNYLEWIQENVKP